MEQLVPKKIHFVFGLLPDFGGKPFSFFHWAAIKTAKVVNPDYEIFYWTQYLPEDNFYFNDVKKDLIIKIISAPDEIFGNKLFHVAHKADVVRLKVLQEYGGIYLDIDTVTVKSFDTLLNYKCALAKEIVNDEVIGLCNAIIVAMPRSKFIQEWINSYKSFRSKGRDAYWNEHSVKIPFELSKNLYSEIQVLPTETFLYPDWSKAGLTKLFVEKHSFPNAYAHHLWESLAWGALSKINEYNVHYLNNSYSNILVQTIANELTILKLTREKIVRDLLDHKQAKLNLGCGSQKKLDFVNCDLYPESGADIVFDLAKDNWLLLTDCAIYAELHSVIEHISGDLSIFFKELYRVMRHDAIISIIVPHPRHDWFITDPTHVRAWHPDSFDFLDREKCLDWFFSGDAKSPLALYWGVDFKVENIALSPSDPLIEDKIKKGFNTNEFYSILPYLNNIIGDINVTLRVRKNNTSHSSISVVDRQLSNTFPQWLEISNESLEFVFNGELGKQHQELLASGIKQQLRSDEEKQFIIELNQYIANGWKQDKIVQHFLTASLYCYPHELPKKWFEDVVIPKFLLNYFVDFMFETPSFLKDVGEASAYHRYVRDLVNFIHLGIANQPESPLWQHLASIFTQRANFTQLYFNTENLKEIYVKRAEIMEIALKQKGFQLDYVFSPRDKNRKKIRVGFLSNHFTPQTETFSILPAFEHLDRGFEVILYANVTNGHQLEKYCESRVARLVQLPKDLNAKVQMIRQDDLDMIWIGTNVTAGTNQIAILALHRLARIQGTLFSSPVTTGFRNMNFYISGELSEPLNADEHYSEQLIKLKNTGYCFNYDVNPFEVTVNFSRQILGIAENSIIFSAGANVYKIVPELIESWASILSKTPNSILLLYPFAPSWSSSYPKEPFIKHLQLFLEKFNVKAEQLIVVESLPTRADVKECLKLVDIYLDSHPYTGSNSNVDPLELGLPVIVMEGNSMRTRQGAAILRSIGLDDLVVQDEESYINLAVKLGTNADLRKQYREQILEKMSNNPPFLDSRAYSAQIGQVLRNLFEGDPQLFNLSAPVTTRGVKSQLGAAVNRKKKKKNRR